MTYPGWSILDSTQSASTRALVRLIGVLTSLRPSGGRTEPLQNQVHLAAEAEVEDRVQERGDQRERGEEDPRHGHAGREAQRADPGDHHAHALRETRWRLGFCSRRWSEPWPDQIAVQESVGRETQAGQRPD